PEKQASDLKTLTGELAAKAIDAIIILGGANPAYSAPADIAFAGALREFSKDQTKYSLHLGTHQDETAVLCDWHINEAHYLEAWGDIRGYDGTVTIQQPLIAPLHGGKSAIELLATLIRPSEPTAPGAPRDPMDIVKAIWQNGAEVKKAFPNYPAPTKPAAFEVFWQESVRSGVVAGTQSVTETAKLAAGWESDLGGSTAPAIGKDEFELNFRACPALYDGRFANNGWLQELPKPLTKISWDNAAFMSPKTGDKLGVKTTARWTGGEHGRMEVNVIELKVKVKLADGKEEDRTVKAPAWILPDHADDAITVHLGHGRERAGQVAMLTDSRVVKTSDRRDDEKNADGKYVRGFNVYPLRTANTWVAAARAARVGGGPKAGSGQKYFLACTQGHWAMAEKDPISGKMLDRRPVRHGTLGEYRQNPMFAKIPPMAAGETLLINENVPQPKQKGEHKDHAHGEHARLTPLNMYAPAEKLSPGLSEAQRRRWAIALDLSACTGCSACVVACQSENNTPVVGKDQVTKGREMYWINIDRYYDKLDSKDPSAVKVYFQPRMCVQCENAPCEIVCPVGATVHSTDGLNDMAYNRCVGTRYCSNNCPYKVRRFNWYQYSDYRTGFNGAKERVSPLELALNPDVTVRSKGVMEKCTFCVHRIKRAKEASRTRGTPLVDGEMQTACQQACPAKAITFGDRNDPDSQLLKTWADKRSHGVLVDLNTQPSVRYLALVRNRDEDVPMDYLGSHGKKHGKDGHDDHHDDHGDGHSAAEPATAGNRS
ncbi:MAG: 4Fe-4S dicluster domain-containing protein, partial [Candidatus Sumerlaeia bacterium]|nr:4Fe-4S dicluster domain-containing protein [Candidatus Sumerlaeia bacterium]